MTHEWERQIDEGWQQEETTQHSSLEVEFEFYNQVQQGDLTAVMENLQSRQYRKIALEVMLSNDLVQNFRYHCIILLAMITRFCIEGGMPGEEAYRRSDFYILKIDAATTIDQIEILHDEACIDFTKHMQNRKRHTICSKPIALVLNYIYTHMHENVTVKELAKAVGLNPSYLSRLFHTQMGCTVHQYILDQKINTAKQWLQFSDKSFVEISNLLGFSSQSHFIQVFSKCTGMTPKRYRDENFRTDLMSKGRVRTGLK